MWPKLVIGVVAFKIMCSVVNASSTAQEVPSLPFCGNKNSSGALLVSTLDGKLSALNVNGSLSWEFQTGPGPLLISNIHNLELTNNGEWIRIIPSLTGTLYKFDGNTIDPISISAESLLRSSFRYSDDLVIAGGLEVSTYGVNFHTGQLFYECNQSRCSNHQKAEMDDVVVIERSTQTIRAIEPRTGRERWNFTVGLHNLKLPQVSCIDTKIYDLNVSAIVPEGLLSVSVKHNPIDEKPISWKYKFGSPIVRVWKWDGLKLFEIDLFEPKNMPGIVMPNTVFPSIYIGMHKKQLYIHESVKMQNGLQGRQHMQLMPAESHSLAKIPWKPISASAEDTEDDSTALSVLNNSEYVNGNGYYLYAESEDQPAHCDKNESSAQIIESVMIDEEEMTGQSSGVISFVRRYLGQFIGLSVIVVSSIIFKCWPRHRPPQPKEIIIVEKPVEAEITRPERKLSEKSAPDGFTSRFMDDFQCISCLGKGGFGVVFQVKQKYDDCDYAIKRITLPNEQKSRDRVMREVKALAKLDHKNIIRYFSSWVEHPPTGWEAVHDKDWIEDSKLPSMTYETTTTMSTRQKSYSVSIDIDPHGDNKLSFYDDDDEPCVYPTTKLKFLNGTTTEDDSISFIEFMDETSKVTDSTVPQRDNSKNTSDEDSKELDFAVEALSLSDHWKKKIDWKRPGRKHHSWDFSQTSLEMTHYPNPPMYLYIQMQLCQKESLKDWLTLHVERDYERMLEIFLQILDAVEYVHLRKLIHRDLKPSNIFFSLDGQIKVGDFGLVKDIESAFESENSRRSGQSSGSAKGHSHTKEVGTTLYMSPEQANGRHYDYKVDIYSLGVILFELLMPFNTAMERIKTLTDIKSLIFPAGFDTKYPAEYELLHNMLVHDPSKRLTTIGIRARSPFAHGDNETVERQHFNLDNFNK